MKPELYLPVLKNFENLFKSRINCNVIIQAGEGYDQKEILAHSVVLCCQSNYFDIAFSSNWAKKKDNKYIFKKPNISPYVFEIILSYLYCGKIDLNTMDTLSILKLLVSSDELGLDTLNKYIKNFLIENRLGQVFEIASRDETYVQLKSYFLETVCKEPSILFGTEKILSLQAQTLEELLEREDLTLNEIEVWNNLIKWIHAQHPAVNKDPSKWTKSELISIKKFSSRFIPLIRFHDITLKKYHDKVIPYEYLLPKRLKLEISKFHLASDIKQIGLLPSRFVCNTRKIDSVIINSKYLKSFTDWIDKNDKTSKTSKKRIPYKFNLILRGSHDGFNATTFHTKCDDKGATIVIAKIKGTNRIVGGYNPIDWSGDSGERIYNTKNSFIFSFENYKNINTGRVSRVTAICYNSSKGPCFGKYKICRNDLAMNFNGRWNSTKNTYKYLNIPRNFDVDDYEVFQIVKIF